MQSSLSTTPCHDMQAAAHVYNDCHAYMCMMLDSCWTNAGRASELVGRIWPQSSMYSASCSMLRHATLQVHCNVAILVVHARFLHASMTSVVLVVGAEGLTDYYTVAGLEKSPALFDICHTC